MKLQTTFLASCLFGLSPALSLPATADIEAPQIRVEAEGDGDTTLFIPGLSSSPRHFRNALSQPVGGASHWVNLPGFAGEHAPTNTDAYVGPVADAIIAHIVENDLKDIQLVGHSLGGVLAIIVASEIPERIDGVLIVDSVPFLPALFNPAATEETAGAQARAMQANMLAMDRAQFDGMLYAGLSRQALSEDARTEVYEDILASDQTSIASGMADLMSTDFTARLSLIESNVTLLIPHHAAIGVNSEMLESRYRSLYAPLDQLETVVIENSAHFIQLDQPAAFEAELLKFLEAHND